MWSYEETPYQGGLSLFGYKLDKGKIFESLDKNIEESENLTLGDHEGVLLKRHMIDSAGIWTDKIIYIFYPEYSRVVQMYAGEDVSREDAIKIAENITLEPIEGANAEDRFADWSEVRQNEELKFQEQDMEVAGCRRSLTAGWRNTGRI